MLGTFFRSLFNKTPEKTIENQDTEEVLASIKYLVKRGSHSVSIDIELSDYDDSSASALCEILDVLSEDYGYTETINIIKDALIGDNQEEMLIKIFTHISDQARDKIIKAHKESTKDEPCIKPSDMLQ